MSSLTTYLSRVLGDAASYLTTALIFFKRQILLIAACAVLGALGAVAYYQSQPDFYRSSMVVTSDFLDIDLMEKTMEDLNYATATGQKEVLASLFNAEASEVAPLLSFSVELREDSITSLRLPAEKFKDDGKTPVIDRPSQREMMLVDALAQSLRPDYYYITAESADPTVFPKLEAWMTHMLDNNPSITRERDMQLAELNKKKSKLEEEMAKLDRLKLIYHEAMQQKEIKITKNTPGDVVINQAQIDPLPVYNQYLEYFNQSLATQTEINALGSMVTVLSGFSYTGTRGNQPWQVSALWGVMIGLVIGFALTLLMALVRYVNKAERAMRVQEAEAIPAPQPRVNGKKKSNGQVHETAAKAAATTVSMEEGV